MRGDFCSGRVAARDLFLRIILISPKNFFVLDDLVIIMVLGHAMISPKIFFPDDLVITLVFGLRLPNRGGSLHTMKEDSYPLNTSG